MFFWIEEKVMKKKSNQAFKNGQLKGALMGALLPIYMYYQFFKIIKKIKKGTKDTLIFILVLNVGVIAAITVVLRIVVSGILNYVFHVPQSVNIIRFLYHWFFNFLIFGISFGLLYFLIICLGFIGFVLIANLVVGNDLKRDVEKNIAITDEDAFDIGVLAGSLYFFIPVYALIKGGSYFIHYPKVYIKIMYITYVLLHCLLLVQGGINFLICFIAILVVGFVLGLNVKKEELKATVK